MYIPQTFNESDPEKLQALMRENSFAPLITHADNVPFATHLPFLIDTQSGPHVVLRSHMARANPQWRHFRNGEEALVIFQGPHTYISPSWYESELMVPTWNYAVVHAYGVPRPVDDAGLFDILNGTVGQYEAGREAPWSMDSLPPEFVEKLMKAIVGFEIEITRLEGKVKMSQNRSTGDRRGVIAGLEATSFADNHRVADFMRAMLPE